MFAAPPTSPFAGGPRGASIRRAAPCLHGLAAVAVLWLLVVAGSIAAAQGPAPQRWNREAASALLAYIERIDRHGLDPADYAPAELLRAIQSDDAAALEKQATHSFGLVAGDLAMGHVRPGNRGRNYIFSDELAPDEVARLIDVAIATRNPASVLERLAPADPQYAALRRALASLPAGSERERRQLEINLERWRWLPRALGERHLMVNIPEYRLRLFDGGAEISGHRVVVGKPQTPTLQFSANVEAVVLNPSWHVPQSIIAESVGRLVRTNPALARRRGYTWRTDAAGRLQVTQQPGPGNALGQMKLDMPNPFAIYVHDTPEKALFEREARAFSHGCIRAQAPLELVGKLLAGAGWSGAMIDEAVAGGSTRRVPLAAPMPIHIVYVTAVAGPDGRIAYLDDPYALDGALAAKLR